MGARHPEIVAVGQGLNGTHKLDGWPNPAPTADDGGATRDEGFSCPELVNAPRSYYRPPLAETNTWTFAGEHASFALSHTTIGYTTS